MSAGSLEKKSKHYGEGGGGVGVECHGKLNICVRHITANRFIVY